MLFCLFGEEIIRSLVLVKLRIIASMILIWIVIIFTENDACIISSKSCELMMLICPFNRSWLYRMSEMLIGFVRSSNVSLLFVAIFAFEAFMYKCCLMIVK